MHDPLFDSVEAGKALDATSYHQMLARGLAAIRPRLEKPAPDPAIAAQRDRYRMNRAQRRAHDRQEHA